MQIFKSLTLVCFGLAVVGCGAAHWNPKLKARLDKRAPFDLDCRELTFTPLEELDNGLVTSYGVTGCGHKATYVLNQNSWVLNALDGKAGTTPEDPPPNPPPPPK